MVVLSERSCVNDLRATFSLLSRSFWAIAFAAVHGRSTKEALPDEAVTIYQQQLVHTT